ncbi:hypothetical protein FQN55_000280 [Onygenales sp. PD_40]|nr:hypothetical protein FQN55_000280 [Onygenales sp. PD_40]KAK2801468.1 hypothetical protein FQN51_005362 [Onygenales sp. PD_10]
MQVGVGDVVLLSSLAWKIYRGFQTATDDLQALSDHVFSIHFLLLQSETYAYEGYCLHEDQRRHLQQLTGQCEQILKQLESVLDKYEGMSTGTARWNHFPWLLNAGEIKDLKERMMHQIAFLTNFNTSVAIGSLSGLNKRLDRLLPGPEGSALTAEKTTGVCGDSEEGWTQFVRSLEAVGIDRSVIDRNRRNFVEWIATAIEHNEQGLSTSPNDQRNQPLTKHSPPPILEVVGLCSLCNKAHRDPSVCEGLAFDSRPSLDLELSPIHSSTSHERSSRRASTMTASKTRSVGLLSGLGRSPSLAEGFGVGSGPQISPYHRASVSSADSVSIKTNATSNDSSATTASPESRRKGKRLMRNVRSRVSNVGLSSSAQYW